MSATIETRTVVVRAKRPGGFWSAGRFFADTATEHEVTRAVFEQLVEDRTKGFLELGGEGFDDILEVRIVRNGQLEADLAEVVAKLEKVRVERDAALAEASTHKARVTELEAEIARRVAVEAAPAAPTEAPAEPATETAETAASTEAAGAGKPPKKPKA